MTESPDAERRYSFACVAAKLTNEELQALIETASFELWARGNIDPEAARMTVMSASRMARMAHFRAGTFGRKQAEALDVVGRIAENEPSMKRGLVGDFCEHYLKHGCYELAYGDYRECIRGRPFPLPIPSLNELVRAAETVLLKTFGKDWDLADSVVRNFNSLRSDYPKLKQWERRKLVRDALKSGAATFARQAAKADK